MLGLVFTEFMEMVEAQYSLDMVDAIIDDSELASGGSYTAVALYDFSEMQALISALSRKTATPVDDLVRGFGQHLLRRFFELYPQFFTAHTYVFEFIKSIDQHIHVEVKKLYPNAQLPIITASDNNPSLLTVDYHSHRPMADLAQGLLQAAVEHYQEAIDIRRESVTTATGYHERFILLRASAASATSGATGG